MLKVFVSSASLVFPMLGAAVHSTVEYVDGIFVAAATLEDSEHLRRLDALGVEELRDRRREIAGTQVHHIVSGSGVVFGYRKFGRELGMVSDTEYFEKLSVALAGQPPNAQLEIALAPGSGVVVAYTAGSSVWAFGACSGYVESGRVLITPGSSGMRVEVQGPLTLMGNASATCKPHQIDISFIAGEAAIETLTPWLGASGKNLWSEGFRPADGG